MVAEEFKGFVCWSPQRISEVINKEAVSVDRANFLATHAPLSHIKYERSPHAITDTSEEALLTELRSYAADSRHAFTVIQGIPGTGKSHLIRWLKERYAAADKESSGNDLILLIERAQCTLRGTLEQIIGSGAFADSALSEELRKLRSATTELSNEALADNILNQFQIAHIEVRLQPDSQPPPAIMGRLDKFLLDFDIRQELKKPNGPIDRIMRFLARGNTRGVGTDEVPRFVPEDFLFPVRVLQSIKEHGRPESKQLADLLRTSYAHRDALTKYLNNLFEFAVGRVTSITTDDLKRMFNELRRQLRRSNRKLTLFIEDITAFTGLDTGLVDVLATQHTGEGNRDFCRLISVVGITDSYYNERFPDNMKERVTHRLTLNARQGSGVTLESEMLQSPDAIAGLSARYLNAMRLEHDAIQDWADNGAHPEAIPNACYSCSYRPVCHAAFGSVSLVAGGGDATQVGLYPFNARALNNMYDNINSTSRTPRSLLTSVIEYVLESYTDDIRVGTFPPPANQLGNDFQAPQLANPIHINTINTQGENEAKRIDSLVRFWGDRTVYSRLVDGHLTIGDLPEETFKAFGLPFIAGEPLGGLVQPHPVSNSAPAGTTLGTTTGVGVEPGPIGTPNVDPVVPTQVDQPSLRHAADIANWVGGQRLQYYKILTEYLSTFIRTSIDWEAHSISYTLVNERTRPGRLVIEAQAGQPFDNDHIKFSRSNEFAGALQALVQFNDPDRQSLTPGNLAGHLTGLGAWLDREESRIVQFVSSPRVNVSPPAPLADLLMACSLLAAGLLGRLSPERSTPHELYLDVISLASSPVAWEVEAKNAQGSRSPFWTNLLQGIASDNAGTTCVRELLIVLNCPQGDAAGPTRFVNAATAIDTISFVLQREWSLQRVEFVPENSTKVWAVSTALYNRLATNFPVVVEKEQMALTDASNQIEAYIDGSSPQDCFLAVQGLLDSLRVIMRPYSFLVDHRLTPDGLSRIRSEFEMLLAERSAAELPLALSRGSGTAIDAAAYIGYFRRFTQFATQLSAQLQAELKAMGDVSQTTTLQAQVEAEYASVLSALKQAVQ